MSKHGKSGGDKPHSNPDEGGGKPQERKISGDAHVRGEIEVDFAPDLIQKYKTAKETPTPRDNKKFIVEILTLAAVVIYAGLTFWQVKLTRRAVQLNREQFLAGQRPWLGFTGPFKVDSFRISESGGGEAKTVTDLQFSYELHNFGNAPARKITLPSFLPAVSPDSKPPEGWQKKHCDFEEKMSNESYLTNYLMPGTSTGPMGGRTFGGSLTEISKIKMAWIFGCVVYRDTVGGPIHHASMILSAPYTVGHSPTEFTLFDSDAD